MEQGGVHTAHIHPHSVISGTYYVAIPKGAAAIKFEDPRLAMMMAAPPKKPAAARANRPFVTIAPQPERFCSGKAGCATRFRQTGRGAGASA